MVRKRFQSWQMTPYVIKFAMIFLTKTRKFDWKPTFKLHCHQLLGMVVSTQTLKITSLFHQVYPSTSSIHELLTLCRMSNSETNEKKFDFKEEIETSKVQTINEIKNVLLEGTSILREAVVTHSTLIQFLEKLEKRNFIRNNFVWWMKSKKAKAIWSFLCQMKYLNKESVYHLSTIITDFLMMY